MLDHNQRIIVESIKNAKRLKISIGGGKYEDDGQALLTFDMDIKDIRKVRHDIALAVQDFLNKTNREEQWKQITTARNSLRTTGSTGRK